jgi:hypothetical protein
VLLIIKRDHHEIPRRARHPHPSPASSVYWQSLLTCDDDVAHAGGHPVTRFRAVTSQLTITDQGSANALVEVGSDEQTSATGARSAAHAGSAASSIASWLPPLIRPCLA